MPEMQGAADILMIPDPSTFRTLPWAPDTGWFLCDLKFPDGRAVPSARGMSCAELRKSWLPAATSSSPVWKSSSTSSGSGIRACSPRMPGSRATRRMSSCSRPATSSSPSKSTINWMAWSNCCATACPPSSFRSGPSRSSSARQLELHSRATQRNRGRRRDDPAAQRREADRAPPRLPRHLHVPAEAAERHVERLAPAPVAQSEWVECFVSEKEDLSEVGKQYLAGLLAHARGACAFATPTINGYSATGPTRARPGDLGQGEPRRHARGSARARPRHSHRKPDREPAANPYLYFSIDGWRPR